MYGIEESITLSKVSSTFMALLFSSSIRKLAVPSLGFADVLLVTLLSRPFDEFVSISVDGHEALERQDWYISKKTDLLGQKK